MFRSILHNFCSKKPAADRVALLIGNSEYFYPEWRLSGPARDIEIISHELKMARFAVRRHENLKRDDFEKVLTEFENEADGAKLAIVLFSGHGLQIESRNYLLPTDYSILSGGVSDRCIDLQDLVATISSRAEVTAVFLDACRKTYDEARETVVLIDPEAVDKTGAGLAQQEFSGDQGRERIVVNYATEFGKTANDTLAEGGGASPFCTVLKRHIGARGLTLDELYSRIAKEVPEITNGEQRPVSIQRDANTTINSRNYGEIVLVAAVALIFGMIATYFKLVEDCCNAVQADSIFNNHWLVLNSVWMGSILMYCAWRWGTRHVGIILLVLLSHMAMSSTSGEFFYSLTHNFKQEVIELVNEGVSDDQRKEYEHAYNQETCPGHPYCKFETSAIIDQKAYSRELTYLLFWSIVLTIWYAASFVLAGVIASSAFRGPRFWRAFYSCMGIAALTIIGPLAALLLRREPPDENTFTVAVVFGGILLTLFIITIARAFVEYTPKRVTSDADY